MWTSHNTEFAQDWVSYERIARLNHKDYRDTQQLMRDFLEQSKWILSRPMTQEEFDNVLY